MDTTIEIPGWLLSNVGGFVGFWILSGLLLKGWQNRREEKEQQKQNEEQSRQKKEKQEQQLLDLLLPGPWKTLYEFLCGSTKMCRDGVLLSATTFRRDISDIPRICPGGFNLILRVSFYNLGPGKGNCHEEFIAILGDHVKFPSKEFVAMLDNVKEDYDQSKAV